MNLLRVLSALFLFIFTTAIYAGETTYIKEYRYKATDDDSKSGARKKALDALKKETLEEAVSFVSSETSDSKNIKTEGKKETSSSDLNLNFESISAGFVKSKVIDEKWDGESYWVKAELSIDIEETKKQITEILKSRKTKRFANQAPDWFASPPVINGKRVRIAEADTSLGAIVIALVNSLYTKQQLDENSDMSNLRSKGDSSKSVAVSRLPGTDWKITTMSKSSVPGNKFETEYTVVANITNSKSKVLIKHFRITKPYRMDRWDMLTKSNDNERAEKILADDLSKLKVKHELVGVPANKPEKWYALIVMDNKLAEGL